MYTLEYRYKRTNKRWTSWLAVEQHEDRWEGIKALGQHVSNFETFSVRLVRYNDSFDPIETVAEYKFNQQ